MKVLIVAATETEADVLRKIKGIIPYDGSFRFGKCDIKLLITGVGSVATSWSMMKWFSANSKPDIAVNIGIAGSYRNDIRVGDVVTPVSDCFADAGIETDKGFLTLSEAGMSDSILKGGRIAADNKYVTVIIKLVRPVEAVTVNTSTGSEDTIQKMLKKFNPGIETMEGATFFYICLREKVPFIALRSVSNRVEPRNKKKWDIPLALNSLSEKLKDFLLMLE
ncbi:MAG: futalosine hydrolase [Bacteroidetes bacterium RBG_13_43_22]|nr:MAG: futalosine hydrolase [Bacteroidetes bacterium RBG_13_43_22]